MSIIRWTWQCDHCEDEVESYSNLRHDMNYCSCGKSAVDLEDGYARGMGDYTGNSIDKRVDSEWVKVD